MKPKLAPDVADEVPWSETITDYDLDHLVTYLRLLDADREQADWRQVAALVLGRSVRAEAEDVDGARRCWESHLARARWMSRQGYHHLLRLQQRQTP